MLGLEFGALARRSVLSAIGRKVLGEFLAKFQGELLARNLALPDPSLPDQDYFQAVAALLQSPEHLPDRLNEALFTIEEMATVEGQERLQSALAHAGLNFSFESDSPPERLTLQVWLQSPELLYREHCKQDEIKLTSFECFASPLPRAERRPICVPDSGSLQALTAPLVLWFAQHTSALHTTRIDFHLRSHGQFWFLIRHGDTARWTRTIEDKQTEFIRFTLEAEEAIFYSAEDDELWISAKSEIERELYRTHFGLHLRGSSNYFSQRRIFTLHPLTTDGADALDPAGIPQIQKITLRQMQVLWEGGLHDFRIDNSADLFASLAAARAASILPAASAATVTRAALLVKFADSRRRRQVEIGAPHKISLQRPSDLYALARWLSKSVFNLGAEEITAAVRRAC